MALRTRSNFVRSRTTDPLSNESLRARDAPATDRKKISPRGSNSLGFAPTGTKSTRIAPGIDVIRASNRSLETIRYLPGEHQIGRTLKGAFETERSSIDHALASTPSNRIHRSPEAPRISRLLSGFQAVSAARRRSPVDRTGAYAREMRMISRCEYDLDATSILYLIT